MIVIELLKQLRNAKAEIKVVDEKLSVRLPKDIAPQLKARLIEHKEAVKDHLLSQSVQSNKPKIEKLGQVQTELSYAQQRLWFLDQLQQGSAEYNMPVVFDVEGAFDVDSANAALSAILSRHEILRTVYVETEEGVRQQVQNITDFEIPQIDLTHLSGEEQQKQLRQIVETDVTTSFELSRDLMIRTCFISLCKVPQKKKGVLLFNMHHIASDGWSLQVLTKEFFSLYQAFRTNRLSPLAPLALQYSDYSSWQRKWFAAGVLKQQLEYWQEQLDDLPLVHNLPLDYSRPEIKAQVGGRIISRLPKQVSDGLNQLAKEQNVTAFMLLHAALAIVLSRHSNSNDVVIGTPVANRMTPELEPLIGFFVNTLVLRVNTAHSKLADYLKHVRQVHLDGQGNQDVPFEQLVERLNVPRSSSYSPLFQVMLTTQNDYGVSDTQNAHPGIKLMPLMSDLYTSKFDLELNMSQTDRGVNIHWTYDVALFSETHVKQIDQHLCRLLQNFSDIVGQSDVELASVSMISDSERQRLIHDMNNSETIYPDSACIHTLFQQQCQKTPQAIAVKTWNQQVTYQELEQLSTQLANYLVDNFDIQPNVRVALCIERSIDMVVAVLGILKAGAAYAPVDASFSDDVIAKRLSAIKPLLVLTSKNTESKLPQGAYVSIDISQSHMYPVLPTDALATQWITHQATQLAYILTTSGSTGEPKLVGMNHQPLVNLIYGITDNCQQAQGAHSILQFASIGFDMSYTDIGMALLQGGTLNLIQDEEQFDTALIASKLLSDECSLVNFPFAMLLSLATYSNENNLTFPALSAIISTAERLLITAELRTFFSRHPNVSLVNHFGPTETHVCTYHSMPKDPNLWTNPVPIGRPMNNTSCYILDPNLQLVPIGAVGELYVGGDCLSIGYLGNESLTQEKFIADPFSNKADARLYKTGDLVRWNENGELDYIGRCDSQIKLRGFRIELSAIENALANHETIKDVCVILDNSGQLLVTYYTSDRPIAQESLKNHLAKYLPDYMIPTVFIELESWPLSKNGKVNKAILPDPRDYLIREEYVAPLTKTESELVTIWHDLLDIPVDKIGTLSSFFDLGGHSLLITRLISYINSRWKINLALRQIFNAQTIEKQAVLIEEELLLLKATSQEIVSEQHPEDQVWEI